MPEDPKRDIIATQAQVTARDAGRPNPHHVPIQLPTQAMITARDAGR